MRTKKLGIRPNNDLTMRGQMGLRQTKLQGIEELKRMFSISIEQR